MGTTAVELFRVGINSMHIQSHGDQNPLYWCTWGNNTDLQRPWVDGYGEGPGGTPCGMMIRLVMYLSIIVNVKVLDSVSSYAVDHGGVVSLSTSIHPNTIDRGSNFNYTSGDNNRNGQPG